MNPSAVTKTRLSLAALALALLVSVLAADTGQAKAPVEEYGLYPSTTQAGGHPDLKIKFRVGNRRTQGFPDPCFCDDPKDIIVNLPEGFIGNPHVTPQCTAEQFAQGNCPIDSQVGMIAVLLYDRPGANDGIFLVQPIFNMEPPPGTPGLLAFAPSLGPAQYISLKARTGGDFGLTATVSGLQRIAPVVEVLQYMWGVPADPVHDLFRGYTTSARTVRLSPSTTRTKCPSDPVAMPRTRRSHRAVPCCRFSPTRPHAADRCRRQSKPPPLTKGPIKARPPTRRSRVAANSPSTPASAPSRRPPRPTRPAASTSISASLKFRAPRPRRHLRSRKRSSPFLRGSRSTPTPPTARRSAATAKPTSAARALPNAPTSPRSGPPWSIARRCRARSRDTSIWANRFPGIATG